MEILTLEHGFGRVGSLNDQIDPTAIQTVVDPCLDLFLGLEIWNRLQSFNYFLGGCDSVETHCGVDLYVSQSVEGPQFDSVLIDGGDGDCWYVFS
ncbi:hypothetical protein WICPIJ_002843 [Wickerhamomyces pijperi]|uniref:Uncharacterized protein n=1 Tax=Wickerhamomyces pijperi TaxID=599730 RepID=A0A9P8QAP5_WICPI|nr:hypothetical protein WICPIJ_002843 [Wickerhamomyces pijperi]